MIRLIEVKTYQINRRRCSFFNNFFRPKIVKIVKTISIGSLYLWFPIPIAGIKKHIQKKNKKKIKNLFLELFFISGATIFCGTFALGANFDYRLIFLE